MYKIRWPNLNQNLYHNLSLPVYLEISVDHQGAPFPARIYEVLTVK